MIFSSGYSSQSQKKRLLAKVQSECNVINIATKPEPGVEYLAPHPCHAPACKEPPTYQVNKHYNNIYKFFYWV